MATREKPESFAKSKGTQPCVNTDDLFSPSVCMSSEKSKPEPKRTTKVAEDADKAVRLSEAEITAIAIQVAKTLKSKELRRIAGFVASALRPKHFWLIGKSLGKSPVFWIFALAGIGSVCITAWKAVPHFVKEKAETLFNRELTNQIVFQFQEPRISNIVAVVAGSEAANILRLEISPEIAKFQMSLNEKMQNVQSNLARVPDLLASNFRSEAFPISDTNRVAVLTFGDGAAQVFFKCEDVPVLSSLHGIQASPSSGRLPIASMFSERNVVSTYFAPGADFKDSLVFIYYVADMRQTNRWQKVEIVDQKVFMDGNRVWFRQGSGYH